MSDDPKAAVKRRPKLKIEPERQHFRRMRHGFL